MPWWEYKCGRNGGARRRYMERAPWTCPNCGEPDSYAGHLCRDCHRRVCCSCFHHDMGACLGSPGCDIGQPKLSTWRETCLQAIQRKGLDPGGGGLTVEKEPESE